jgi:hypothetical protein
MLYGAFWPIFGVLPGRGVQILTIAAVAVTVAGGLIVPRGSRFALTLLWAAFGMAALGTIGIFSVGFAYVIAALLLVLAIVATPNRSGITPRYAWRLVAGFHVGYLGVFVSLLVV